MRSLTLALACVLIASPARADVDPPRHPTMFVLLQRSGLSAGQLKRIKPVLRRAFTRLPKKFFGRVSTERSRGWIRITLSRRRAGASKLVRGIERPAPPKKIPLEQMLRRTAQAWGWKRAPRHHIIVIAKPTAGGSDLDAEIGYAVRRRFTVSFLFIAKKKDKRVTRHLLERGAGHVRYVRVRALGRAVSKELSWTTLTSKQKKKRAAAIVLAPRRRARTAGLLGLYSGRRPLVKRTYVKKRFHRAEAIAGKLLALVFRRVRCAAVCDVSEVRARLRKKAKPLLTCLERSVKITPKDELRVTFTEATSSKKGAAPEVACVARWRRGIGYPRLQATVVIADARSVH